MTDYEIFLQEKRREAPCVGLPVDDNQLHHAMFPWQRLIVSWAIQRGRAAIFAGTGLGKTVMQLQWAHHVATATGKPCLIVAPLAVGMQTQQEAKKFDMHAQYLQQSTNVLPLITVTNYERIDRFNPSDFGSIVLDESSILKAVDGATRRLLSQFAADIPYRLACTATPAPNDTIELINHAEFLGVMSDKEVLALFFKQDGNTTHKWRLRHHAVQDFWRWMASWAVAVRMPADLGYPNGGFVLPPLQYHQHTVATDLHTRETLFAIEAQTMHERLQARKNSTDARVAQAASVVNASQDQWIVWCHLNAESEALARAIPDAVQVQGKDSMQAKEQAAQQFAAGAVRVLITKPSIFGWGLNWQHCHHIMFVGLTDSWESVYQATRRCWRFGQSHPVDVHYVVADTEGAVLRNIKRKEQEAQHMIDQMVSHMSEFQVLMVSHMSEFQVSMVSHMSEFQVSQASRDEMPYATRFWEGAGWMIRQGDSVNLLDLVKDDAIGLTITSPPFPAMYAYTNSARDMGNVASIQEAIAHMRYLVGEKKLLRATMPGRSCCIHLTQSPAFKGVDGYIGLKDFRGAVIRLMEDCGWIYYGEVCIDKDPQVKAIRTKDRGLLFKTLATNSEHMHMAMADYLLQFRKPGDSPQPIRAGISSRYDNEDGWITQEEWIEWAAPVWYRRTAGYPGGIAETDVLNTMEAKGLQDERHICPLQLGVIERAIKLWSNPHDLVFDPFNGIGSTGYQALRFGRQYLGFELKDTYAETSVKNMHRAIAVQAQTSLFHSRGA